MTILTAIFYTVLLLLGLAVGSFLNVLIDRLPAGRSIRGRSKCDYCGAVLPAKTLIPFLSFFIQRGRSSCCGKKLSWQYPLVEALTAGAYVFSGARSGIVSYLTSLTLGGLPSSLSTAQKTLINWSSLGSWEPYLQVTTLIFYLFIAAVLITLIFTDVKYYLLPNRIVMPAIVGAFLFHLGTTAARLFKFYLGLDPGNSFIGHYLLTETDYFWRQVWYQAKDFIFTLEGSLIVALCFLILILVTKGRGMGGGDLKLAILIGLVCGWPEMMVALFLGFVVGSLVSLTLMALRIKSFGDRIPLGPFLAMATFVTLFYGEDILNRYYMIFV